MRAAILVATLVVVLVLGLLVSNREPAAAQPAGKVQQWEYKVFSKKGDVTTAIMTEEFNKLGADGWEFSGVTVGSGLGNGGFASVFKRPKK